MERVGAFAFTIIACIVFIVKIFTLSEDITEFTLDNYNSFRLWAKLTVSFCIMYLVNRDICNLIDYCLSVKWARFLQNDLIQHPQTAELGKEKLDENTFTVLTDKKFFTIQLVLMIILLAVLFAFSVYVIVNVNEFVRLILGLRFASLMDVPMTAEGIELFYRHATIIGILVIIQGILELVLMLVNKYFIKKLG